MAKGINNKMRPLLPENERQNKIQGFIKCVDIIESLHLEYYLGGNILLDIFREKDISNWPYGIAINFKYEELLEKGADLKRELKLAGFRVVKNSLKLRFKINAYWGERLYELAGWYKKNTDRIRAKYVLPGKLFTPGHYENLLNRKYQTFNPPVEYLEFRFGKDWKIPNRSSKRSAFENSQYWRKR
jgi:hypothetical protein